MSEQLGALYHWSPVERRKQILRHGLRPRKPVTVTSWDPDEPFLQPHVCLSPTPSEAWALSGGMRFERLDGFPEWDLWQVRLDATDAVVIRGMYGPRIEEVQVQNRIPKSRCWHVGTRERT